MKRYAFVLLSVLCLIVPSVFGYEVTERYRLGAVVEGNTYIENGRLAGKVAFMDGWTVYLHDPVLGGYERLFSVAGISPGLAGAPRGIAYVSQGAFAGNFLIVDISTGNTLLLVSDTGSLVGDVHAQGFQWAHAEGVTQIASGPYQGKFALIIRNNNIWHIDILRLEQIGTEINAYLEKNIPNVFLGDKLPLGIAYLPADFPEAAYANMFAVAESNTAQIYVINDQGTQVAAFPGFTYSEGLTYISSGAYQGKLFAADMRLAEAVIRNLDGTERIPASISPIGIGIFGAMTFTWLSDRQQWMFFCWDGWDWSIPTYLVSRLSPGEWRIDDEFRYTRFRIVRNVTDMTAGGTYYLFGVVSSRVEPARFGVDLLDTSFRPVNESPIALPSQYTGLGFGSFVYVPGETITDDRFVIPNQKNLYSFDASFAYPATIINLTGKVTNNITRLCYDPAVKRYYVLDGTVLRVFDASWNQIDQEDLSGIFVLPFSTIAKFTSGDLRGNIVLLNSGDNELYILNFEYQIAGNLLDRLIQEILAAGLKNGLTNSLTKKLENAKKSVEEKNITPAINQIEAFQNEVRAQAGKDIPAASAERWLALSADIIKGLQQIQ